jgi:hypothetical protein
MIEQHATVLDSQVMEQVGKIAAEALVSSLIAGTYLTPIIAILKILNEKSGNYSKHLG